MIEWWSIGIGFLLGGAGGIMLGGWLAEEARHAAQEIGYQQGYSQAEQRLKSDLVFRERQWCERLDRQQGIADQLADCIRDMADAMRERRHSGSLDVALASYAHEPGPAELLSALKAETTSALRTSEEQLA